MGLRDSAAKSPLAAPGAQGAAQLRKMDELIELQRETVALQRQILEQMVYQSQVMHGQNAST